MAIKYLDAKRLQGTNAERLALTIGSSMGSDGNATNGGADLVSGGQFDDCLEFNGSSDYIDMTNLLTNTAMTTTGTIAFWIWFEAVENGKKVFMFGDTTGTYPPNVKSDLYMEMEGDDGKLMIGCDLANPSASVTQWQIRSPVDIFSVDTWYHIALTHDGTSPKLYVDGEDETTLSVSTDLTTWISGLTGLNVFNWARFNHRGSQDAYFEGKFDDIGIWNTALPIGTDEDTVDSIRWLYNTGTGKLASTITSGLRAYYNCDSATTDNNAPANVYPNLPNGTIFNETDTYKYFMFDGTDTWNQMVSS